jgi:hypothetical protein
MNPSAIAWIGLSFATTFGKCRQTALTVGRPQRFRDFQRQYDLKSGSMPTDDGIGLHDRQRLDGISKRKAMFYKRMEARATRLESEVAKWFDEIERRVRAGL